MSTNWSKAAAATAVIFVSIVGFAGAASAGGNENCRGTTCNDMPTDPTTTTTTAPPPPPTTAPAAAPTTTTPPAQTSSNQAPPPQVRVSSPAPPPAPAPRSTPRPAPQVAPAAAPAPAPAPAPEEPTVVLSAVADGKSAPSADVDDQAFAAAARAGASCDSPFGNGLFGNTMSLLGGFGLPALIAAAIGLAVHRHRNHNKSTPADPADVTA